jgi:hypothetical protein
MECRGFTIAEVSVISRDAVFRVPDAVQSRISMPKSSTSLNG